MLSAGWGDTYAQYRAGQAFRIEDLPNGVYYIAVEANPNGNAGRVDDTDNNDVAAQDHPLRQAPATAR